MNSLLLIFIKTQLGRYISLVYMWGNWIRVKWSNLPQSMIGRFAMCISVQFSSVAQSCLTLCNPMSCSLPGLSVLHQLPELAQTHVHWVGDPIQPSHPLLSSSPPTFNLSHHQGLFKWVSSSHQVAKVLEFNLQHQSFQGTRKSLLQHHSSNHQFFSVEPSLWSNSHIHTWLLEKP